MPAHYREEVERQIHEMLALGIIEESSSPWMVPALFARKKSGEIRLCIDYKMPTPCYYQTKSRTISKGPHLLYTRLAVAVIGSCW